MRGPTQSSVYRCGNPGWIERMRGGHEGHVSHNAGVEGSSDVSPKSARRRRRSGLRRIATVAESIARRSSSLSARFRSHVLDRLSTLNAMAARVSSLKLAISDFSSSPLERREIPLPSNMFPAAINTFLQCLSLPGPDYRGRAARHRAVVRVSRDVDRARLNPHHPASFASFSSRSRQQLGRERALTDRAY